MQKEKRIPDDVWEILAQYPFRDPEIRFLRRNENEVFAVRDGAERFVLRIQRPAEGFSLRPLYGEMSPVVYLDGELDLLEFLRECAEFPVQQPVRNRMAVPRPCSHGSRGERSISFPLTASDVSGRGTRRRSCSPYLPGAESQRDMRMMGNC